jgi:hypothetical protein
MNKKTVSPRMQKAAVLITQGRKLKDVADECGICPQTLSEWRSNEVFQILCNQIQTNVLNASKSKIGSLVTKAVSNLESMLDSDNDKIKFEATKEVLRLVGLNQQIHIGTATLQKDIPLPYDAIDVIPLTESEKAIEAAISEASIVDI